MSIEPEERFSSRAADYHLYRPSYPSALLDDLSSLVGTGKKYAEIGSGTGIFTRLLLERSNEVWAVEPNEAMRAFAEKDLQEFAGFHSVAASAEETGLPNQAFDSIAVAQAFHWFDLNRCLPEFKRILTSGGKVALIWNYRLPTGTPFLEDYEQFLLEMPEYRDNVHRRLAKEAPVEIFRAETFQKISHPVTQSLYLAGILGRLFSSSYSANPGSQLAQTQKSQLSTLFKKHQKNGTIELLYQSNCYLGELA